MLLPDLADDAIAQAIKDYFLDLHEGETDYWQGYRTLWLDTGEFDAMGLAERIVERLRSLKVG